MLNKLESFPIIALAYTRRLPGNFSTCLVSVDKRFLHINCLERRMIASHRLVRKHVAARENCAKLW